MNEQNTNAPPDEGSEMQMPEGPPPRREHDPSSWILRSTGEVAHRPPWAESSTPPRHSGAAVALAALTRASAPSGRVVVEITHGPERLVAAATSVGHVVVDGPHSTVPASEFAERAQRLVRRILPSLEASAAGPEEEA